jgi:hypothetical protein
MIKQTRLPLAEVGVALIRCGERILVVYNPRWEAFTLPMTTRRRWPGSQDNPVEPWEDTAARAAAEVLGRTCKPAYFHEMQQVLQSDREGIWKEYYFQVFRVSAPEEGPLAPAVIGEWLTPDDIFDLNRKPLSTTVLTIVGELRSQGLL